MVAKKAHFAHSCISVDSIDIDVDVGYNFATKVFCMLCKYFRRSLRPPVMFS